MTLSGVHLGMTVVLVSLLALGPVAQAATWQPVATPTSALLRSVDFHDESNGLAVGVGHTVLRTTDGGANWNQADGGWFGFGWYDVAWASPTVAYAVGANAVFQPTVAMSTNGGQSWVWENFYINDNEGTIYGVAVSATHVLLAATLWSGQGVVLQKPLATVPLVDWTPVLTVPHPIVGIDADGLMAVAVGGDGNVYTSLTGGLAWGPAVTPTDAFLYDVSVSFPNAVAVGEDGTAIRATEMGAQWDATETGTEARLRDVALTADGAAALVGDGGVAKTSADGGASWVTETSGTSASLWGVDRHDGLTGSTTVAVGAGGAALVRAG